MAKLLLASILWVPLLIARVGSLQRGARAGMTRTIVASIWFMSIYVLAVVYLFFRLGG